MENFLIITPDPQFSEKLTRVLEPGHSLCIYSDITQIYKHYKPYTLIIMDCRLVSESMVELDQLAQFNSKLLLAGNGFSEENQIKAVITGVSGYCEINIQEQLLKKAINSILNGDIWIQRHLFPKVLSPLVESQQTSIQQKRNNGPNLETLSARELDVAKMIGHGKSNKLIASTLFISERTVKAHLTSIFKKLGVRDRLHLAVYLTENGEKETIHE